MVAKISSGKSLYGALEYNKIKVDTNEAKVILSNNMFDMVSRSFSHRLCQAAFEPYLVVNKKTENPIIHISLNPSPEDKLSDEQFADIAEEYMQQMGYGNQPYIVFKHSDIERTHCHIVSLRVDETGKKIDSNFEKKRSMAICRALEAEYELHPATKKSEMEKEQAINDLPIQKIDYKKGNLKQQVGNITKTIMNNLHFQSFGEYRTLLELLNVTAEEIKGEHKGKPYNGLVYSVTDDGGKKVGVPFKSSLYGKSVNMEALQKRFALSKEAISKQQIAERMKPIVTQAMQSTNTKDDFKELLKEKEIGVVFRINEQKRIYGVTFIDFENKAALNGSRLGKEFSANAFEEKYNNSFSKESVNDRIIGLYSGSFHQDSNITTNASLTSLASLFSFEQHGADYDSENFVKRKQAEAKIKQRKRGLGW